MAGISGKSELKSDDINPVYYIANDGKLVRRDDYKPITEREELLAIISSKLSYSRSDLLSMYVHEFHAMVQGLKNISNG